MTSSQGTRKRISSPFLRDILFLFLRAFNALFIHASQSKLTFVPCFHSEQRKTCSSFRFFMSQKKWETRKRNHNHHVVVCDKYFYKYLWLRQPNSFCPIPSLYLFFFVTRQLTNFHWRVPTFRNRNCFLMASLLKMES